MAHDIVQDELSDDSVIGEFTHRQGMIAGVLVLSLYVTLLYLGNEAIADQVAIAALAIISAIWIFRALWKSVWFWITMICIAAAHVLIIKIMPWPFDGAYRIAPLVVLDLVITLAPIWLVVKVARRRAGKDA